MNEKSVEKFSRNWFAWSSYYGKRQTMHIAQLWQHFCCGKTGSKSEKQIAHTFVYQAAMLNILCDYQFVFFVLDELCASHHACCSRFCSKNALWKNEMWCFIFTRESTIFRWDGYFFHTYVTNFFLFTTVQKL